MAKRDYYEVLGVGRDGSSDEVRSAYRKLAYKYHPDRNREADAEQKFKEAAEAYEVLCDADKRARYDRFGHAGLEGAGLHDFTGFAPDDIFSMFGEVFGGLFGAQTRRRGPRRGANMLCEVSITLQEAARGTDKLIELGRHEPCDACGGSGAKPGTTRQTCSYCRGHGQVSRQQGFFTLTSPCPRCGGEGTTVRSPCPNCRGERLVRRKRAIKVQIRPGVDTGDRLRVPGEGERGPGGTPPGDLYVDILVQTHPFLERQGEDLLCAVPVTFTQAALGAEVEIPTLEGKEVVKIDRGTQGGDMIRLRGKGMPRVRGGGGRGDQIVVITVETPTRLTRKQEQLLREFAETEEVSVFPKRTSFFQRLGDHLKEEK